MSESIGVTLGLGFIKTVVFIYDVVTFPAYYLAQQPWKKAQLQQSIRAKQLNGNDPYSPLVRISTPPPHFIFNCNTINELFEESIRVFKTKDALGYREVLNDADEMQPDGKKFKKLILGDYHWFSYDQVRERVDNIAKGLFNLGVRPGEAVLILGETRIEWLLSAQAVFKVGAHIATLYATLGEDGILHGIKETEVTHIVTTHDLLPKLHKLQSQLTTVKRIVYIEGHKPTKVDAFDKIELTSFSQVEKCGESLPKSAVKFHPPSANDTAIIMYTSGSTGVPKGVIITHQNVLSTVKGFYTVAYEINENDTYMGYLPLAHVLELAAENFFFAVGCQIGYSTPHTMTDKSTAIKKGQQGDVSILKPTVMAAVPLVLDRIRKGIAEQIDSRSKFFKSFFNFAMEYKSHWLKSGYNTPILNKIICKKIRAMMGGRIKYLVSGSAPLSPETHDFIRCCMDVILIQGYGLTETAAGATLMDFNDSSTGRVGAPLSGVKIKLCDWIEGGYHATDKPYPRGEIVIGGGSVSAGYYKNENLTRESYFEEDGTRWFYTGDIGEIYPNGTIKIVDRKKDLVKLQFGEYISLGKVETELKSCPYVDNVCIYGDSFHTYLVALVVPNSKALNNIAIKIGKEAQSLSELCRDSDIIAHVTQAIREYGTKAKLNKMELPTKIKLCSEEWSPDSGLVTAALKLRRKNIQDYYKADIRGLYGIENGNGVQST